MDRRAKEFEVLSVALKSQQWSAARRRHEAFIQAELRRLALSDRRKTIAPKDTPDGHRDTSMYPAA